MLHYQFKKVRCESMSNTKYRTASNTHHTFTMIYHQYHEWARRYISAIYSPIPRYWIRVWWQSWTQRITAISCMRPSNLISSTNTKSPHHPVQSNPIQPTANEWNLHSILALDPTSNMSSPSKRTSKRSKNIIPLDPTSILKRTRLSLQNPTLGNRVSTRCSTYHGD